MTAKANGRVGSSDKILKVIGHEIRMDVLRICSERIASPKEIAAEIGESVTRVSNHTKVLVKAGTLVLHDTKARRGAVEHFYYASVPAMIDDEAWEKMPVKARLVVYRTILQAQFAECAAAEAEGAFDADDAHLSWVPFPVDDQGRADVSDVIAGALQRIEGIKEECISRLEGESGQEMVAAFMSFERAPAPGRRERSRKRV